MARLFDRCPRESKKILVTYGVVKNRAPMGGYMPVVRVNHGRWSGHTYGRGLDRDRAMRAAREGARDEATRYSGDYCVAIRSTSRPRGKGL